MIDLQPPRVQRRMDEAVEALSAVLRQHEREAHDGEPCMNERLNMIAWVAHRIGWAPTSVSDILVLRERIAAYKQYHHEEHKTG